MVVPANNDKTEEGMLHNAATLTLLKEWLQFMKPHNRQWDVIEQVRKALQVKIRRYVRTQSPEFELNWNNDPVTIKMVAESDEGELQLADWRVDPTMGITMSGSSEVRCVDYEDSERRTIAFLLPGCKVTWRVENDIYLKVYYLPNPKLEGILNPSSNVQWHSQDMFTVPPPGKPEMKNQAVIVKTIDIAVHDPRKIKFLNWNGTIIFYVPNKERNPGDDVPPDMPTWETEEDDG